MTERKIIRGIPQIGKGVRQYIRGTTWVREIVHKNGTTRVGTICEVLQVLGISETMTQQIMVI